MNLVAAELRTCRYEKEGAPGVSKQTVGMLVSANCKASSVVDFCGLYSRHIDRRRARLVKCLHGRVDRICHEATLTVVWQPMLCFPSLSV